MTKLLIDKLFDADGWCIGYGVFVDNTHLGLIVGPNPLSMRGAEYVLRVLLRIDLDFYPQRPGVRHQNTIATGECEKLQAWTMNAFNQKKEDI